MNNITTTNQKSLSKEPKKQTFSAYIGQDAIRKQINNIVGGKDGQKFITSIISAISTNNQLSECTHTTILSAALLGQSLELSPSPQLGQYYMVPFKKKGKNGDPDEMVATFVLGYKGYVQLAIRSGYYKRINVVSIKEGELVSFDPLTEEITVNLINDDEIREKTPTIGYYAMFEYHNGFIKSIYWSKKKMLAHADKYSAAFSAEQASLLEQGKIPEKDLWKYSSFWYKDFDGMAHKTLLRQLIGKWGIMSIELQKAFEADDKVLNENLEPEFVESTEKNHIEIEPEEQEKQKSVVVEPQETNDIIDKDDDPFNS